MLLPASLQDEKDTSLFFSMHSLNDQQSLFPASLAPLETILFPTVQWELKLLLSERHHRVTCHAANRSPTRHVKCIPSELGPLACRPLHSDLQHY